MASPMIVEELRSDCSSVAVRGDIPDSIEKRTEFTACLSVNSQNLAEIDEAVSEEPEQNVISKEIPAHTQLDQPLPNAVNTALFVDNYEHALEGVIVDNTAGKEDYAATFVDDVIIESDANLHEAKFFTENIQRDLRDRQVVTINSEHEYGNTPRVSENQLNKNRQSRTEKGEKQKKEITLEMLQPFLSKNMRLTDAAKELNVSRSTLKRRLKDDLKMEWPLSKEGKQLIDGKNRKNNGKSPSENNSREHNVVNPINQLTPERTDSANVHCQILHNEMEVQAPSL